MAIEVIGASMLDRRAFLTLLTRSHIRFVGEKGFHASSPWLIDFDEKTQRGIVRSDLVGMDDLRASLAMITEFDGEPIMLRTIGVSGTLRSCEDRFIRKSEGSLIERAEERNGVEDPGMERRMAQLKAIAPGSKVAVSHRDFKLKRIHDDGRVDVTSAEGSFGFTILDLLASDLGHEE